MEKYKIISLIILVISLLNSCTTPDKKFSKAQIISIIKERSTLEISDKFKVLEDTVIHTEGAFDSDYRLQFTLKFNKDENLKTGYEIRHLRNYWKSEKLHLYLDSTEMKAANLIFDEIGIKGLWYKSEEGFRFTNSISGPIMDYEPETVWISVDTVKQELHYILQHF